MAICKQFIANISITLDHTSSMDEVTAELPKFALTFVKKFLPELRAMHFMSHDPHAKLTTSRRDTRAGRGYPR